MNFKPKFEKKKDGDTSSSVKKYESITKYMAKKLITFSASTELIDVINSLLENQISGAPVLNDDNEIVGVIDDKDCLHTLVDSVYHNAPIRRKQVKSYMTDIYTTIHIDSDIVDAANMFLKGAYKRLLVIDDNGKLRGTISRGDILRAIKDVDNTNWRKQS